MPFSWKLAKERAVKEAIRYARCQAGGNDAASLANTDFKIKHPDWCRDATLKKFTVMDKAIGDEVKARQQKQVDRDLRFVTKR